MINNYKELINELEIHTNLRENFEISRQYWIKQMHKGCPKELKAQNYSIMDMPRGGSNSMPLDRILQYIRHYERLIEVEDSIIDLMQKNIDRINELIKQSDNIYNKVAYLKYQKDAYGKRKYTLKQIAEMLVYSEDWIKHISAEV